MKKVALPAILGGALLASSAAHAQSFTYEVVWQPVEQIGGIAGPDGTQYQGGVVEGTYTATYDDGTVNNGTVKCVGTDQPDGGIFAIHLACTTREESGVGAIAYGCNFIGERGPETPLGCVGALQGKEGDMAGRNGSVTMEWYSDSGARGTGSWYAQ
ncbi:hypothetical protein [Erythrobacter rubeus]|uniref:Uncharacterized protein n=1 Tax=Erythrobacter rubeus TaxID=2760803 RepID=A0ABR8KVQ5_9SPHN|nr:hypothetical protein [Erythrobacter rubeus]MBD2843487.1 hypothetical protein [Erythrobacter rubeus]